MIYFLVILLIFGIVFISIVESILMLSANDFVKVNELAINKKSYIHIIKINIKKLILSITNNQNKRISMQWMYGVSSKFNPSP